MRGNWLQDEAPIIAEAGTAQTPIACLYLSLPSRWLQHLLLLVAVAPVHGARETQFFFFR